MRVGVLTALTDERLVWARQLGFQSLGWMRFAESPAAAEGCDWRPWTEELAGRARELGLRLSAIGAFYANPLDPRQTIRAEAILRRAIEVASRVGIRTVSSFSGGLIETDLNPRGGNVLPKPVEASLEPLLRFWEPLAQYAADHGVRLAFEHCPQAPFHLPALGYNALSRPAMWERFFDASRHENLGLEWDPSHLISQLIDPVRNLRQFGPRVFHVHAKDAFVDGDRLSRYGLCHAGVVEHRLPGFGQAHWAEIIHELVRHGYDSDLNIEGRHDPVFRDHPADAPAALAGRCLEEAGLRMALKTLLAYVPETLHDEDDGSAG
jgi:sugar phosphate isomerase/epimerase